MQVDRSDKPSRTVQFDTGMAMTLGCSPLRDPDAPPPPQPGPDAPQQRGTAK